MGGSDSKPEQTGPGELVAPLAITTIDAAVEIGTNKVKFTKLVPGRNNDKDAHLLKDVRFTGTTEDGVNTFEATAVQPEEFQELIAKEAEDREAEHCLFYIHGFATDPIGAFGGATTCNEYLAGKKKAFVVPILWPCGDTNIMTAYLADRNVVAPGAAEALKELVKSLPAKPKTPFSLFAHSMGNFVLRNFAPEKTDSFQFETIFMVAADVDWAVFDEGEPTGDGKAILSAAKNKVHALYSDNDKALLARYFANFGVPALGKRGFDEAKVAAPHPKLVKKDCVGFDLSSLPTWIDRFTAHGYHTTPEALDYYLANI